MGGPLDPLNVRGLNLFNSRTNTYIVIHKTATAHLSKTSRQDNKIWVSNRGYSSIYDFNYKLKFASKTPPNNCNEHW